MAAGSRSILLIEDAPQVAGILVSKLGREGLRVVWTRGRSQAFEALAREPFDLILLSTYLLPERNAWEILDELKARAGAPPVLMLLESEESALEPRALERGARKVILKPFKPTVVAKTVREFLAAAT